MHLGPATANAPADGLVPSAAAGTIVQAIGRAESSSATAPPGARTAQTPASAFSSSVLRTRSATDPAPIFRIALPR